MPANQKNHLTSTDIMLILFVVTISIVINNHMFLNWDVSWHLLGSKRALAGGSYNTAFFDDNPPMVFWFYTPVVVLSEFFHINEVHLCILYNHVIALSSLYMCYILSNQYFHRFNKFSYRVFFYLILFGMFFLNCGILGTREVMLSFLLLPYLFLILDRCQTMLADKYTSKIVIGLMAAIGAAQNPMYAPIIFFAEITLAISQKRINLLRTEFITFTSFFLLYLLAIGVIYPEYYSIVIPSFFLFSPSFSVNIKTMLLSYESITILITSAFVFFNLKKNSYPSFVLCLFVATVWSYVVLIANMKLWQYHAYPALFFSLILCGYVIASKSSITNGDRWSFPVRVTTTCFFVLNSIFFMICILFTDTQAIINYSSNASQSPTYKLVQLFKDHKKSSFYYFSVQLFPIFPAIDYTKIRFLPPWPDCWFIPYTLTHDVDKLSGWRAHIAKSTIARFYRQTTHDFSELKPNYVLTDSHKNRLYIQNPKFKYIDFLKKYPPFRKQWKQYKLMTSFNGYIIYKRTNK